MQGIQNYDGVEISVSKIKFIGALHMKCDVIDTRCHSFFPQNGNHLLLQIQSVNLSGLSHHRQRNDPGTSRNIQNSFYTTDFPAYPFYQSIYVRIRLFVEVSGVFSPI